MKHSAHYIYIILSLSTFYTYNVRWSRTCFAFCFPETQGLIDAITDNNFTGVKAHITRGAHINIKDQDGKPLLFKALERRDFYVTHKLLMHQADPDIRDDNDRTPLHIAILQEGPDPDLLRLLLSFGANPHLQDIWYATPLHRAVHGKHTESVSVLLRNGTYVNAQNASGNTPLHIAAYENLRTIARILIAHGASLCIQNKDGETPADRAQHSGYRVTARNIRWYDAFLRETQSTKLNLHNLDEALLYQCMQATLAHGNTELAWHLMHQYQTYMTQLYHYVYIQAVHFYLHSPHIYGEKRNKLKQFLHSLYTHTQPTKCAPFVSPHHICRIAWKKARNVDISRDVLAYLVTEHWDCHAKTRTDNNDAPTHIIAKQPRLTPLLPHMMSIIFPAETFNRYNTAGYAETTIAQRCRNTAFLKTWSKGFCQYVSLTKSLPRWMHPHTSHTQTHNTLSLEQNCNAMHAYHDTQCHTRSIPERSPLMPRYLAAICMAHIASEPHIPQHTSRIKRYKQHIYKMLRRN